MASSGRQLSAARHGTIGERWGELAYQSDCASRVCRERARLEVLTYGADDRAAEEHLTDVDVLEHRAESADDRQLRSQVATLRRDVFQEQAW